MKKLLFVLLALLSIDNCFAQDLSLTNDKTSDTDKKQISTKTIHIKASNKRTMAIYSGCHIIQLKPGFNTANGFTKGSPETTAAKTSKQKELKIYPNPNNGIFKIGLTDFSEGTIQIIDALGRTVNESNFKNKSELEVNIQDNPIGIYFVKVKSRDQVYTNKIIKN